MAIETFAPLAIRLLRKGVLYEEDTQLWIELTKVQEIPLRNFFDQIGVQLIVNYSDGFAYLRQPTDEGTEEDGWSLPRLMQKRNLTVDQSILAVLLRERMEEHTTLDTASREPILSLTEIVAIVDVFFKERNTQQRFLRDVRKSVEDLRSMGFLETVQEKTGFTNERNTNERFRVKRILKAFIDIDELQQLHAIMTGKL
jgi:Domain of unknown function (DUF4194)